MSGEWFVPLLHGGEDKGLNDAGISNFQREKHLAREVCQNVIDAKEKDSEGIPTVRFELWKLKAADLPGYERFCQVFKACEKHQGPAAGAKARKLFKQGNAFLSPNSEIPVLRISDRNTTGLEGDDGDSSSRWYRLVRGQGTPKSEGAGGGTYGIGQRAPFAFSGLRLLFYSTEVGGNARFMGKYILSTFEDPGQENRRTQNIGYFGIPAEGDRVFVHSIQDLDKIPPDFQRNGQGTDINIVGFSISDWKKSIVRSVLSEFYAAIENEQLVVEISEGGEVLEVIDGDSLQTVFEEEQEKARKEKSDDREELAIAYHSFLALKNPVGLDGAIGPFTKDIPKLGLVKLYVSRSPEAKNKISYMRTPRMQVFTTGTGALTSFQAVLLVDSKEGNKYLSRLEDPGHVRWDVGEAGFEGEDEREAKAALSAMRKFIRESLRSLRESTESDSEDLPELAAWLPEEDDEGEYAEGSGPTEESSDEESSRTVQPETDVSVVFEPPPKARPPAERRDDEGHGEDPGGDTGGGGADGAGGGDGTGGAGDLPGTGDGSLGGEDKGGGRIRASDLIDPKVWKSSGSAEYRIYLHSKKDRVGDVELNAQPETGRAQRVTIKRAWVLETGDEVKCVRGVMCDVELSAGDALKLGVEVEADVDLALSVRN